MDENASAVKEAHRLPCKVAQCIDWVEGIILGPPRLLWRLLAATPMHAPSLLHLCLPGGVAETSPSLVEEPPCWIICLRALIAEKVAAGGFWESGGGEEERDGERWGGSILGAGVDEHCVERLPDSKAATHGVRRSRRKWNVQACGDRAPPCCDEALQAVEPAPQQQLCVCIMELCSTAII